MPFWKKSPTLAATAAVFSILSLPCLAGDPPIAGLSDEFDNPATLADWSRIRDVEMWPADQLELLDINTTEAGRMTIMPHTCSWFEDYRGPFVFKEVEGDFVATASVRSTNRAGTGAPGREYSLGGVFVRTPRDGLTPATWTPDGENYTFLSLGAASNPGTFQMEVKDTQDSVSILEISNAPSGEAEIQTARLGDHIIHLVRPAGGSWGVHRRYFRDDFPARLQVGMVTYTDWEIVQNWPEQDHNVNQITHEFGNPGQPSNPDLIASFDYFRFRRPQIPAGLEGADFSNPAAVSDAQLLSFLGATAVPVELSAFALE